MTIITVIIPLSVFLLRHCMRPYFFTGKDTLRCLALATVDEPIAHCDMDLTDAKNFFKYEVKFYKYMSFSESTYQKNYQLSVNVFIMKQILMPYLYIYYFSIEVNLRFP